MFVQFLLPSSRHNSVYTNPDSAYFAANCLRGYGCLSDAPTVGFGGLDEGLGCGGPALFSAPTEGGEEVREKSCSFIVVE